MIFSFLRSSTEHNRLDHVVSIYIVFFEKRSLWANVSTLRQHFRVGSNRRVNAQYGMSGCLNRFNQSNHPRFANRTLNHYGNFTIYPKIAGKTWVNQLWCILWKKINYGRHVYCNNKFRKENTVVHNYCSLTYVRL